MDLDEQPAANQNPSGSGDALLKLQNTILKSIAKGADLAATCTLLCREVESLLPAVKCSVLRVDGTGALHPLAGPSLPKSYSDALDGAFIGPSNDSCGTAAYLGEDLVAIDIATDPRWADYKHPALPHGLRACWSSPIIDANGVTIATFGIYFADCRGPTPFEQDVVRNCVHLCIIAIDPHQRVTNMRDAR